MNKFYLCAFFCVYIFSFEGEIMAQDSAISVRANPGDSLTLDDIEDSVSELFSPKSYFQMSLGFLSNNVYMGRRDSIATPYITPSISYYHKYGLYMTASASYLPVSGSERIDLVTLEGGYTYKENRFEGQLSAAKFWYNSASFNVKSEIKEFLAAFVGYDFGFIKPTLMPTLNFGNKPDFALTMGLEHSFYVLDDAIDITPAFNANASNLDFYNSYYRKRRYSVKRKKEVVTVKGTIIGQVLDSAQFKMLDYEFSLPINYVFKKITLNFTPFYAIPVNPSMIQRTRIIPGEADKVTIATEKLTNSFFYEATVYYKF